MKTKITYFALAGDAVKIGSTRSIETRMVSLQVSCRHKITLLRTADIPEREAHRIAETLSTRLSGEWFAVTEPMVEWIDNLDHADSEEIEPAREAPAITAALPSVHAPVRPPECFIEIPVSVSRLAPETREWLLRKTAAIGVPPQTIMIRALDDAAVRERASATPPTVPPMPTTNGKAA